MTANRFRWQESINVGTGRISAFGYACVLLLAGSLGYWASTAQLSGAVVAPGTVAAAGRNILMQHPEGGVVREILVVEGDTVDGGQPLILLDTTAPLTQLNRLRNQQASLRMSMLRLEAERDGLAAMAMPPELWREAADDPSLVVFFEEQRKEFDARRARFVAEREVLDQRVSVYEAAMVGLEAQKQAVIRQLEVVRSEIDIKKNLLDRGLTNRSEYTVLLRSEADLVGEAGGIESQIAISRGRIVEARADSVKLETVRVQDALAQLNEARTALLDIEQQIVAADAVLTRTTLRSPANGVIVSSLYNAVGSVVAPGEKVFEILPTLSTLIVEAQISPNDIRKVHVGQSARLRLSALNQRLTPEIEGTVIHVSADRLINPVDATTYYAVRLRIGEELPAGVTLADLTPGMPVEVMVQSESRTFVEYLARPLLDSFNRAFTEE